MEYKAYQTGGKFLLCPNDEDADLNGENAEFPKFNLWFWIIAVKIYLEWSEGKLRESSSFFGEFIGI